MSGQRASYNVQYNIPRVNVSLPGRQNRLMDGELRITPGITEAMVFFFGNQDGVPLNLVPFKLKFIVWALNNMDFNKSTVGQSEIVFSKEIQIDDPYSGQVEFLLSDDETLRLGRESATGLRWGMFMINEQQQIFPVQVSRSGARYGTVILDVSSGIPIAELIRSC